MSTVPPPAPPPGPHDPPGSSGPPTPYDTPGPYDASGPFGPPGAPGLSGPSAFPAVPGSAPGGPYLPAGRGDLATWLQRVGAFLIDRFLSVVPLIVLGAVGAGLLGAGAVTDDTGRVTGYGPAGIIGFVLIGLGYLSVLVVEIWNRCVKAGRTGQSIGRRVVGLYLVGEQTGQPIGAGMAFVREICHFVDGIICNVGYLFPLWDAKRQTLADKIVSTLVVTSPPPQQ